MTLFSIISLVVYITWIIVYFRSWQKIPSWETKFNTEIPLTKVSIIVPARNEENKIESLVRAVCGQDFPPDRFELIVVDDHSDDATASCVKELMSEFPQLQYLHAGAYVGKKAALSFGIASSTGELIVTVDADISFGDEWIKTIVDYYALHKQDMIILPVMYHEEKNWFEKIQSVELLSLVGTTFSAAALHSPVMCNGANLFFTRNAFEKVNGYGGNENISGGDDMFLLMKIKKTPGLSVGFIRDEKVIGWTRACTTLRQFIDQRTRWSSKAGSYRDLVIVVLAIFTWCANLAMVWTLFSCFSCGSPQFLLPALAILKMGVDFLFIRDVAGFFQKKRLLVYYPTIMFIYPFYATLIPLAGIFYRPGWKGRNIKT